MKKYRVFYSYFSDSSIRRSIDCINVAFLQGVIVAMSDNSDIELLEIVVLED